MGAEAAVGLAELVKLTKETQLVKPVEAVQEQDYFLSNLDQNVAVVMKTIYVFDSCSTRVGEQPGETLRLGLSKVLVHYFPLAGRLGVSSQGKLHIEYRNQGVVFAEAEADARISDLGDIIRPDPSLLQLVYSNPKHKHILEVPPMTVQVTSFKCGGFVLGLCINHCMFDGIAAMEFVHSWAELSKGAAQPSLLPHLDRSMLKAREPPVVSFAHLEYAEVQEVVEVEAEEKEDKGRRLDREEDLDYRVLSLDLDQLEQLKQKVNQELEGLEDKRCTTFELLSSLVWQCRTHALGMVGKQESKLLFAVDYRLRIQPELPRGYMGNGIMLTYAMTTAGELKSMPLSQVVLLVREAVARIDDDYIRSSIDCFEQQRFCPSLFATLLISTWSRLSFHTTDFGWGEPLHSGPVGVSESGVCLFLSRPKEQGRGINLMLALPAAGMQRFHEGMQEAVGSPIRLA